MELLQIAQIGGINVAFVVGIIGILRVVRQFDVKKLLGSGFYLIAVVLAGLMAGLFSTPAGSSFGTFAMAGISHAGVASLVYQYGKKLFHFENDKFTFFNKE